MENYVLSVKLAGLLSVWIDLLGSIEVFDSGIVDTVSILNINWVELLIFLTDANSFCIVSGIKYPFNLREKFVLTNHMILF